MPATAPQLEARLRAALQPVVLQVLDESAAHAGHSGANAEGFGSHFRVRICAAAFAGKTRIQRHRLVYDALRDFTDAGLHALAIEIIEPSPEESPP